MDNQADDFDVFFRSNYEQIDVRENPAHWKRLQGALALGLVAVATKSFWAKLFLVNKFLLTGIVLGAAGASTFLILYFRNPEQNNAPQNTRPVPQTAPAQQPTQPVPTTNAQPTQANGKLELPSLTNKQQDTLRKQDSIKNDSLVQPKKDSLVPKKKKMVIF